MTKFDHDKAYGPYPSLDPKGASQSDPVYGQNASMSRAITTLQSRIFSVFAP